MLNILNTRILLSVASIAAAITLVVGATFAFFTDTATSQDNTFSSGSADLVIAQEGEASPGLYGNDIPAPAVNEASIFPGFTKDYVFWLKNNSQGTFKLSLNTSFDDVVTTGNAAIADQLTVQFTCASDTDGDGLAETPVATTGTFTVNTWDAGSAAMGELGPNDGTSNGVGLDEAECKMTVNLPTSSDNSVAGSSVRFDGVFAGTQVNVI